MDPSDGKVLGNRFDPQWELIRRRMGFVRRLANRFDLAAMTRQNAFALTGFSLARSGNASIVSMPTGGKVEVSTGDSAARFAVEWVRPETGKSVAADTMTGEATREFTAPFDGDAVLRLSRQ